jgi:signal transduction histidine kinase
MFEEDGVSLQSFVAFASYCRKGIMVWNSDLRLAAVNSEVGRIIGVAPEEFQIGITYDELALRLDSIARSGSPEAAWVPLRVKDFKSACEQVARDTGSINVMPGGNETGVQVERMIMDDRWMVSILTDLSALGQEHRETARQRLYFKTILENLTDGVMQIDQNDCVTACNRRLFELFGVDPDAFEPGMDVAEFATLHGDLATLNPEDRQTAIQERAAFARGDLSERTNFCMTRELSSGMILNVVRTALPNGGAVITASDATESLQLVRQRQMLKTVIDTIDEGVTLVEPDRTLGIVNDKMLELYSIDREHVRLGEDVEKFARAAGDLVGLEHDIAEAKVAKRVSFAIEGPPGTVKGTHKLKNGRSIGFTRTILSEGGAVATYRDVTQETRARELLEQAAEVAEKANRLKSDFLATVTHDLRTPMHGVLGMAALLERTALDDHQKKVLNMLIRSSQHMVDLIDGLLSISSIETGNLSIEMSCVDLHELATSCIEIVRPEATRKSLRIGLQERYHAGPKVLADSKRITQVLLNLLGNAVKFTETGDVNLSVETVRLGDSVRVTAVVSDTGIGIPEEQLARIFEKFAQVTDTQASGNKGVGLGLSIAKALTDLMGGTLQVSSEVGEGTRFELRLNLAMPDHPDPIEH